MGKINKGTILVIEDRAGFRRIYHDVLASDGYEVIGADDGEIGWNMIRERSPDLILLDLMLPKLNGFELLEKIRTNPTTKNTPVIVLSVLGEQKDIQKGLDLGANDYVVKGFYSSKEILKKVSALMEKPEIKRPEEEKPEEKIEEKPERVALKKEISSYKVFVKEDKADAKRLQENMDLPELFECPYCHGLLLLELTPDPTRTEGHWFVARFVCPECRRSF